MGGPSQSWSANRELSHPPHRAGLRRGRAKELKKETPDVRPLTLGFPNGNIVIACSDKVKKNP